MTRENRRRILSIVALLILCITVSAEFAKSSILSNDISSVDGHGDTLWLANSHGVNFTTNLSSDTVIWYGDKDLLAYKIVFKNSKSYLSLIDDQTFKNDFYIYNHYTASGKKESLNFSQINDSIFFYVQDFELLDTNLWIAATDGGIVKYRNEIDVQVFIPGDTVVYTPEGVNKIVVGEVHNKFKRVVSICKSGENSLWVGAEKNLWRFNTLDSTWDSIGFPDTPMVELSSTLLDLVPNNIDSNSVNLLIEINDQDTLEDAYLYTYNALSGNWRKISDKKLIDATDGFENDLFALSNSGDKFTRFTISDTAIIENINIEDSKERINNAEGVPLNFKIQDISFSSTADLDVLVLGTTKGLLYSLDEYNDEVTVSPLNYIKRSVLLKAGLEETYSYPSILTGEEGKDKAFFAYNLSKDSKVSIDIYDFNMDHVVRILSEVPRSAGSNTSSGRSTVEASDYWDGTARNDGGQSVPPGVYYYRIKTDKGEKAFGKVIVAKN